jgi:DNA repair exonuclease SbcCD ATPase subunit
MSAATLNDELKQLERRRGELTEDSDRAEREYRSAQDGLVSGTTKAASVTAAHSASEALKAALSSLDSRIEEKRAELSAAQADEQSERNQKRLAELRDEAAKEETAFKEERQSLHDAIEAYIARRQQFIERKQALRAEAGRLGGQLGLSPQNRSGQYEAAIATAEQIYAHEVERQRTKAASREASERQQARERQQRERVMADAA